MRWEKLPGAASTVSDFTTIPSIASEAGTEALHAWVQGFSGIVAQLDLSFVVQSANAGFESVFAQHGRPTVCGLSLQNLLGASAWALVANEARRATLPPESHHESRHESRFVRHVGDGERGVWLEFCLTPNVVRANAGIWLSAHNVDQRIAHEREL